MCIVYIDDSYDGEVFGSVDVKEQGGGRKVAEEKSSHYHWSELADANQSWTVPRGWNILYRLFEMDILQLFYI